MVQVTRKRVGEHKLIFLDVDGVFALLVKTHLNCEFGQRPQADERDDGVDVRILSLPFAFQHSKLTDVERSCMPPTMPSHLFLGLAWRHGTSQRFSPVSL